MRFLLITLLFFSSSSAYAADESFLVLTPNATVMMSAFGVCKTLHNPTEAINVYLPTDTKEAWESIDTRRNEAGELMVEVDGCPGSKK